MRHKSRYNCKRSEVGFDNAEVEDIYCKRDNILLDEIDHTYQTGSECIDTIVATRGIMIVVKGCEIFKAKDLLLNDHQSHAVDINQDGILQTEVNPTLVEDCTTRSLQKHLKIK